MLRRRPRYTRTVTRCPDTTSYRSRAGAARQRRARPPGKKAEEGDEEEQQEQQRHRILERDEQVPHLAREACPRARLRRRRLRLAHGDGPGTLVSVRWCRGGEIGRASCRERVCQYV